MDPEPTLTWLVTRYRDEIRPGDFVFIWRTGKEGGICVVAQVDSVPEEMRDLPHERQYWVNQRDDDLNVRVRGRILSSFPCISREDLRSVQGLERLSVFHGWQQATNFRVRREQGEILLKLTGMAI
jgi:hypothetical protein